MLTRGEEGSLRRRILAADQNIGAFDMRWLEASSKAPAPAKGKGKM